MNQEIIKEAIGLLEKAVERLAIIDTISECEVRRVLALLRELADEPVKNCLVCKKDAEPCKTCKKLAALLLELA